MKIPKALTIAGSDSGGGAGIQADLKTFAALGVYGMSAITALTAQNTTHVHGVFEIPPDFVSLQIRSVIEDIGADAIKTGMLSSAEIISRVARDLREMKLQNIVVDPVMVAKSGDRLLRPDAVETMIRELFPLALVVTPNLQEAASLAGFDVTGLPEMREAAIKISGYGPRYVLIKGGHLEGTPLDLLYDGKEFHRFENPRFETLHTHGTGCTFASAIAAGLAKGLSVPAAAGEAKSYITGAIRQGLPIGKGHGPVHHFFKLYESAGSRFDWGLNH